MNEFSLEDLKKYNGIDGNKAYVAYNGLVYDVTDSFLWKGGKHQACHFAGTDLTGQLETAPHGLDFLNKFPIIGKLKV